MKGSKMVPNPNNEQGFSLVQVMIAAGMLGLVSLGTMRLMENQSKSASTTESKFESSETLNDIRLLLSERDSCRRSFGITPGNPNTGTLLLNSINPGDVTELYYVNVDQGVEDLRYTADSDPNLAPQIGSSDIRLLELDVEGSVAAGSSGQAELLVTLYRGSNVYGPQQITKRIPLNVLTDSSGYLIDCSTGGVTDTHDIAKHTCEALGGTYDANSPNRAGGPDCHDISPYGTTTFNGDVVVADGFSMTSMSDETVKKDIEPLTSSLESIRKLKPVNYDWKSNGKKEIGFIAQNVKELYPSLVSINKNGKLSVKYGQLGAVNLAGIQELDRENSRLNSTLQRLEKENSRLEAELSEVKKMVCEMRPEARGCL